MLKMVIENRKKMMGGSLIAGFLSLFSLFPISNASALTYSQDVPVSFTFNRSISVSVSSDLHIYNLTPGTAADSNIITVSVATNNITGYVLTASVGNNTHSNPSYNNTNLNHTNGSTFTTVATNASLATLSTDNTWGYSTSTDNGSTWSNYSGLPLYTATNWKELASVNNSGTTSLKFKIGAKASAAQPSGDYTNVINFTATTNYAPATITDLTYMQDFASLDSTDKSTVLSSMTAGTQYQLIDNRDNKTYYISKLTDGNIWMTQNLDYSIVNNGAAINSTNTDVPSNWSDSLTNTSTTLYTWTFTSPHSYDPGDLCWDETIRTDNSGTLENATIACGQNGNHYHIGNYYNWPAAVAMANTSGFIAANADANQSICPAGWTLPKGGSNTNSGSFDYLISQAALTAGVSGNIYQPPFFFNFSGVRGNYIGYIGEYWSSIVKNSDSSYVLTYNNANGMVSIYGNDNFDQAYSVRCVAR